MKQTVFVKKYIKSVDDLPKDGQYIAHYKRFSDGSPQATVLSYINSFNTEQIRNWTNNIDWYLLPVELPDEAVIVGEAMTYSSYPAMPDGQNEFDLLRANDFEAGANYIINKLIKP